MINIQVDPNKLIFLEGSKKGLKGLTNIDNINLEREYVSFDSFRGPNLQESREPQIIKSTNQIEILIVSFTATKTGMFSKKQRSIPMKITYKPQLWPNLTIKQRQEKIDTLVHKLYTHIQALANKP